MAKSDQPKPPPPAPERKPVIPPEPDRRLFDTVRKGDTGKDTGMTIKKAR